MKKRNLNGQYIAQKPVEKMGKSLVPDKQAAMRHSKKLLPVEMSGYLQESSNVIQDLRTVQFQ